MEAPATHKGYVKGLAKGVMEELIRADMTMQEMQIQQWARIAAHPPKGAHIPKGILEDFGRNQYLSLQEAELTLYVKRTPKPGFWDRAKLAMRVLRGKTIPENEPPYHFQLCSDGDEGAWPMTLKVTRSGNGEVNARYHEVMDELAEESDK